MRTYKYITLLSFLFLGICNSTFGQETNCNDGIDNDGDGLIDTYDTDCYDPGCVIFPTEQPNFNYSIKLKGEFDADPFGFNWTAYDPPMVGDIDGDGLPEILKMATWGDPDAFFVINGEDQTLQQICILGDTLHPKTGNLVIGDVDKNGYADVFAPAGAAIERWEFDPVVGELVKIWTSDPIGTRNRPHLDIIDLNGDGNPEIIPNYGVMINSFTGKAYPGDLPYQRGDSNELFAFTADGEPGNGQVEVLAGSKMYNYDFAAGQWVLTREVTDPDIQSNIYYLEKSAVAVADFDLDGDVDAIVTNRHNAELLIWDLQTPTILAGPFDIPADHGGRANVGNFDADPYPEFVLTAELTILAFDDIMGGTAGNPANTAGLNTLLWQDATSDNSGHTQSSIFDFENDGIDEIIYRDRDKLRVYRGRGNEAGAFVDLINTGLGTCVSRSGMEYPVIADVDGDFEAEIIVACKNVLKIFESDTFKWVNAPAHWNTQAYAITGVNDDLTIPNIAQENYKVFNTYISQSGYISPNGVPVPNLSVTLLPDPIDFTNCPDSIGVTAELCNAGSNVMTVPYYISVFLNNPYEAVPGATLIDEIEVNAILQPGECKQVSFYYDGSINMGAFYFLANHQQGTAALPLPADTTYSNILECSYVDNLYGPMDLTNCMLVPNEPPVLAVDTFYTSVNDDISGVLSFTDPEGDSIIINTTPIDGPTNGDIIINPDGTFIYTPDSNFVGTDVIDILVCDNGFPPACDTVSVVIIVESTNSMPVAVNDTIQTSVNTPFSGDLLANDTDADGDSLFINTTPLNGPSNGTLVINPDGTFTYTPNDLYIGPDSFDYVVCDNGVPQFCDTATVVISVIDPNLAPVADPDNYITDENVPISANLLVNDSDPNGDGILVNLTPVSNPTNGVVTLLANGDFTYTPNLNYYGVDSFIYQICDDFIVSKCDTALVSITIEPVNIAPSAIDDTYITTEDVPVSDNLLVNDGDEEGDNITISTTPIVPPTNGTLVINPDGTFTYTPDLGFIGNDSFTYQICDDGIPMPLCSEATVTIIVEPSNELVIYEGLSPNGDGMNDFWKIKGIERYPNNVVQVYNRWGNLVWEVKGYNNSDKAWRGDSNKGLFVSGGNELPDGTYFYRVDLGDGSKATAGYVVLNR